MSIQDKGGDISSKTDRKKQKSSAGTQYRALFNEQRRDPELRNDGSFQALLQNAKRAVLAVTKKTVEQGDAILPQEAESRAAATPGRGADNPLYAQKRAERPYSDAQGERLKQAAQESRKAAEKAAAQLKATPHNSPPCSM